MKKWMIGFGFVALGAGAVWWAKKSDTSTAERLPANEGGYCIALRGNGEAEPAHWGALAKTVEQLGMPSKMAGGSSATISMMLMEAIADHPMIRGQSPEVQKERASLMLKSLLGYFQEIQKTKTWADIQKFYGLFQSQKDLETLKKSLSQAEVNHLKDAQALLQQGIELNLLDPVAIAPLMQAFQSGDAKGVEFYLRQLIETVQVFGKFNAEKDDNLFFRAGIVNFAKAAETFGEIANFYAATASSEQQKSNWDQFLNTCAPGSRGLSWIDIVSKNPFCSKLFSKLFTEQYANPRQKPGFEARQIGTSFTVFPTTAVLTDRAADQFRQAQQKYANDRDLSFGRKFALAHPEDLKFGYWGDSKDLKKISQALDSSDEKNKKFLPLGRATWKEVLSLSPAEPGLSTLKEFSTVDGSRYISAGGWSDLHPVPVLKASGCESVVYLTREGGESLFAQGVAKRLLNLDRNWNLLSPELESSKKLNNDGDPTDLSSLWSRLYNVANPDSSLNRSLKMADAVLCANWNAFAVQKDFVPLIENSYRSAFWINPEQKSGAIANLAPVLKEKKSGCVPY